MTLKDLIYPEAMSDRRKRERRTADRHVRYARNFWLAVLTGLYLWSFLVLHAQANTEAKDRRAAVAANLRARRDDCHESNDLRAALRLIVRQSHASLPAIYKLFPQLNTPSFRAQQERIYRFELSAFAARNCKQYAQEAQPRR